MIEEHNEENTSNIFDELKCKLSAQFYHGPVVDGKVTEGPLGLSVGEAWIDDVSNQIIMRLISDWVQSDPQFQKPLNRYVEENMPQNIEHESQLKSLQRSSKTYRDRNEKLRCYFRENGAEVPPTPTMKSKRHGIAMSQVNYKAIYNLSSQNPRTSPLLGAMENRRLISSKKVSNSEFVQLFDDYESWCSHLKDCHTDEEFLINSVDFFTLQEKCQIDFMLQLGTYMDTHNIKEFKLKDVAPFFQPCEFPNSYSGVGRVFSELGFIFSTERIFPIIFESDRATLQRQLTIALRLRAFQSVRVQAQMKSGIQEKFTIAEAVSFLRKHFNILERHIRGILETEGKPNGRRIRCIRQVMDQMLEQKGEHTRTDI